MEKHSCFEGYADGDPQMERYHDEEWGKPCRDEKQLLELFLRECFQAGLSWKSILHKRENFRAAFDQFDIDRIAAYSADKIDRLMQDPGIIRNRKKIEGAVTNARCVQEIRREYGSFTAYLWHFTGNQTVYEPIDVTRDELSDEISADMKKRGMKFVGSVTIFSYIQSVGIIYSHPESCFRFAEDHAERFFHNRYRGGKVAAERQ